MRAGRLRHQVWIDRPVTVQDDTGADILTFAPVQQVFAAVEPIRGTEALKSERIMGELDTRILMRWSPVVDQIDATWRIRHGSTVYNIAAPPIQKNMAMREVELLCKSGVNNG